LRLDQTPQASTEDVPDDEDWLSPVLLTILFYASAVAALLCVFFAFDFNASTVARTYLGRCAIVSLGVLLGLFPLGHMLEGEVSLAGVFFMPILLLLAPVSACFTLLGIFGFGFGTGLLTFFYEVSVETTPVGAWRITLLPPTPTGILYHSQIYENPEALRNMYTWISANGITELSSSAQSP
jgi:hypothetical protein